MYTTVARRKAVQHRRPDRAAVKYGPGQTADVPEAIAHKWIDAGGVSEAKEPGKRATKAAPPKRTR
jgi:hypothetical protein